MTNQAVAVKASAFFFSLALALSLGIKHLSKIHASPGPEYTGIDHYIILIVSFFSVSALALFKLNKPIKTKQLMILFGLAAIPVLGTSPLFENDQYRYLWEGKVLANGQNPYRLAPSDSKLNHIEFKQKKSISFNKLTSPYPPLGIAFYALFSPFTYERAMLFIQLTQLILVCFILVLILPADTQPLTILFSAPFLFKELIQGVHLDTLATLLFIISLANLSKAHAIKSHLLFFASIWTKILPILFIPYLFISAPHRQDKLKWAMLSCLLILIPLALIFTQTDYFTSKEAGLTAFSKHWYWNAGLFYLLHEMLRLDFFIARILCLLLFTAAFTYFHWVQLKYQFWTREHFFALILISLYLCSPVLNAWYLTWALLLLLPNSPKISSVMAAVSCIAYLPYGLKEWADTGSLIFHAILLICLLYLFKQRHNPSDHFRVKKQQT